MRRGAILLASAMTLVLAGCGPGTSAGVDASQVAVRVNGQEISVPQLEQVIQRHAQSMSGPAATRRVLDAVVDQELAAQAARKRGLERDPRVIQAMETLKRELLAKAYADMLAESAALPSSDEVDQFYEAQPALFAQRRFYQLQEIAIDGAIDKPEALRTRVEGTADAASALEAVRDAGLRSSVRQLTISPEDVPLALLERLSTLRDGQSLLLPQPGGARVLTVIGSRSAPLSREAARRTIQQYLINERKGKAVGDALKALRNEAKIEYEGRFAEVAGQKPAAAASAPAVR